MTQQSAPMPFLMAQQSGPMPMLVAQQQAMLGAVQRQMVNLAGGQPPQQPQGNPQPQQNAAAQVRAVPGPAPAAADPPPEDREETAARQLKIAQVVLAEADTAERNGEQDRAAKMPARVRARLETITTKYADTAAAGGAQEVLDKIAD
jgi:hypothetical protein